MRTEEKKLTRVWKKQRKGKKLTRVGDPEPICVLEQFHLCSVRPDCLWQVLHHLGNDQYCQHFVFLFLFIFVFVFVFVFVLSFVYVTVTSLIVSTTIALSTWVRMAQRAHMMRMVRRTGNIANNRNLAKPLMRRMSDFFLEIFFLLAIYVWHRHPGAIQILRENCHEDNCPEMEAIRNTMAF